MKYPSAQAYNEALQMASVAIVDAKLRGGRVETDSLGLPFGRTGSFAITFKIAAGGSNYAFRCFLQNRATIHERYDAISSHLNGVQLPYFVDFTYLDEGIRVESVTYPTVRMSWAGGVPLGIYIQDHHADPGRMTALHQQIQGMALALGAAGLAHGDIQGGNLLIGDGGAIKLVDYDGMYVPSIAALGAIETGHPNFQHPERAAAKPFDARVDQFSFALLHTVIAALIEKPGLWSQLNSDPDKLLIGESDIADPFSSPAFAALTQLRATGSFARSLQAIASAPYAQVPDFTDFLNRRNIPRSRASTRTRASGSATTSTGSAPWYADHIPGAVPTSQDVPSGGALGSYVARDPVIDASTPHEWVGGRPGDVEVIGRIKRADVGETGKDLPYVRLVVCDGNPELSIDVWADGLRRFAEQGITVNKTWTGHWISARGVVQGPIGSPTGERYCLTITDPDKLERINAQQARWRLSAATPAPQSSQPAPPKANADALSALSSSSASKRPAPASPASPVGTATVPPPHGSAALQPQRKSGLSTGLIISAGIFGGLVLLILVLILASTGSSTSDESAPQTAGASEDSAPNDADSEPAEADAISDAAFRLYEDPETGKPIRWDRCKGPVYVSVDYGNLSLGDRQFAYLSLLDALLAISAATKTTYAFAGEITDSGDVEKERKPGRKSDDAIVITFASPPEGSADWRRMVEQDGSAATAWFTPGKEAWDWNYIKEAGIQISPNSVDDSLQARLMAELAFASGIEYLDEARDGEIMGLDWSSPQYGPGDRAGLAQLGDKPCN